MPVSENFHWSAKSSHLRYSQNDGVPGSGCAFASDHIDVSFSGFGCLACCLNRPLSCPCTTTATAGHVHVHHGYVAEGHVHSPADHDHDGDLPPSFCMLFCASVTIPAAHILADPSGFVGLAQLPPSERADVIKGVKKLTSKIVVERRRSVTRISSMRRTANEVTPDAGTGEPVEKLSSLIHFGTPSEGLQRFVLCHWG